MHKTLTALALALLLPFASGLHAADKAERELRYSEFGPNRGARAEALMWFDEQLRERTGNQLGLNIVWGGALLSAKNSMQGVSKIAADMASAYSGYEPGILVAYEVANAVQSTDEWGGLNAVYKFMTSNEAALAEQESNNLKFISSFTTGPTMLLSTSPVAKAADLEGKTIRASGFLVDAFDKIGADAVALNQGEAYEALSTGVIDGTAAFYYTIDAYKQYEVADYVTELQLGQSISPGIFINTEVFNTLTPEQQTVLMGLGKDFIDEVARRMYESRFETREKLIGSADHPVNIVEFDPALRTALLDAANEVGETKWLKTAAAAGLDADKMLADYKAGLDEFQEVVDSKGYPWDAKGE